MSYDYYADHLRLMRTDYMYRAQYEPEYEPVVCEGCGDEDDEDGVMHPISYDGTFYLEFFNMGGASVYETIYICDMCYNCQYKPLLPDGLTLEQVEREASACPPHVSLWWTPSVQVLFVMDEASGRDVWEDAICIGVARDFSPRDPEWFWEPM